MKKRQTGKDKSIIARIRNTAKERKVSDQDAFQHYVMDRFLFRLGQSEQAKEFYLKGGFLVANLLGAPHRMTRDLDFARRKGPPEQEDLRERFKMMVCIEQDDAVIFNAKNITVVCAEHDKDGYDGVRVGLQAVVGGTRQVSLKVDIGFGDAVVPGDEKRELVPFLLGDSPAMVRAVPSLVVVAEKLETLIAKFPGIEHRLKDLLDLVLLSGQYPFNGAELLLSTRATFNRRNTESDLEILKDMREEFKKKTWLVKWATMKKDKSATTALDLPEATQRFADFVGPILQALSGEIELGVWEPDNGWSQPPTE